MKIGMGAQIWLGHDHNENWSRMLDEMSLVGLDGFEMFYSFFLDRYEHRVAELRQVLAMHDLQLSSCYTGNSWTGSDEERNGVGYAKRIARFVAEVGSQWMLVDGGRKVANESPAARDARIGEIADNVNGVARYAHGLGINVAWHQHWGSLFDVEDNLHLLLARTDPDVLRFCPDTAQLLLSGFDVLAIMRRYATRIGYVHYKDITFAGRPNRALYPGGPMLPTDEGGYLVDSRGRFVELGRGEVDFPGATEILHSVGYDGWLVDDFDFTGYEPRSAAQACKDYINLGLNWWSARDIRRGIAPKA